MPVLQVRVELVPNSVSVNALCAGYELGAWRADQLVEDIFDRHLLDFALTYTEAKSVSSSTALQSIRDAAVSVYTTDKYRRRGEFGELLLHSALVDFYGAEPAVSKIYYEDSSNDVVKGFDSVHVVADSNGEMKIWLGEAKFYSRLDDAMDSVLQDVQAHLATDFLRKEFVFITRKVDASWPHAQQFKGLIARARSLDDISSSIVMPIFLTYDSDAVDTHNVVSNGYIAAMTNETAGALLRFESRLAKPMEVEIRLILLPLKSKARLVELMHAKLKALQGI
ncbi:hypothetical protein J2Y41_001041 [Arthrobacter sp. 1088]|uniref:HamA C-terminal domain-containing protein n=1 Tax=Arthrobacter sp. 1088 TaxID=2817768 RepID=UPI00285E0D66|nr:DUF1837 domain-containing protein [Arthrobacter sp. 1088]MDR6685486.1 hypothetical protein [Arthrobacter sp. 1088]